MASPELRGAVVGLGRLGHELLTAAAPLPWLEMPVAVTRRGASALPDGVACEVVATLEAVLARDDLDVVVFATGGDAEQVAAGLRACALAGRSAVTSGGLLCPEHDLGAVAAGELDALARARGVHLVSTGVNPGFLLDVLPAICATLAPGWASVTATRVVEASQWGSSVLAELGIGQPLQRFVPTPPISLRGSLRVLARGLGVDLADELVERRMPIAVDGAVAGFDQRVSGRDPGGRTIDLRWVVAADVARHAPEPAGVHVTIDDAIEPLTMRMTGRFSADPYPATASRMLLAARAVRSLPAGLIGPGEIPPFARPRT